MPDKMHPIRKAFVNKKNRGSREVRFPRFLVWFMRLFDGSYCIRCNSRGAGKVGVFQLGCIRLEGG